MNLETLRLSKWVWLNEREGVSALFHSLTSALVFLEPRYQRLVEELKSGSTPGRLAAFGGDAEAIVGELVRQGLAVPVGQDDDSVLRAKQREYIQGPSLETMFLLLTDACNLRCAYCLINCNMPSGQPGSRMMSWDVAKGAIDMYFANLRPTRFKKTIVFYGGEPLLGFHTLKRIVSYIETEHSSAAKKHDLSLVLITNGTKLTDEIAAYLAVHREIGISISLDGDRASHDQMRVYPDGSGTFADVIGGIEKLHRAGRRDVNISATIDEHNIGRLDELLTLHGRHGFQSVNFNLLLDTAQRTVDVEYTRQATGKMIEYFEKARKVGLHEDRIMRKVRALGRGTLHPFDCRATGQQIAVSPDGSLGLCHEGVGSNSFFFGKVSKDFVFEEQPIVQEWAKRSPLMMPQCHRCPALGICGGGCAYSAFLRHGSIWGKDDKFCQHSMAILEWLVWDVYSRI